MLRSEATRPAAAMATDSGPLLGLGPIRIPSYIDRPEIVTAISDQEYRLSENQRWAEGLDKTIPRVLSENLSRLIPGYQIVLHPWPREPKPEQQIIVDIQEFHVDQNQQAHLDALWTLRQGKNNPVTRKFSCRLPASTTDFAKLVEAESQCLGRLSRDMAGQLPEPQAIGN